MLGLNTVEGLSMKPQVLTTQFNADLLLVRPVRTSSRVALVVQSVTAGRVGRIEQAFQPVRASRDGPVDELASDVL